MGVSGQRHTPRSVTVTIILIIIIIIIMSKGKVIHSYGMKAQKEKGITPFIFKLGTTDND
jgi:hypothetical protein